MHVGEHACGYWLAEAPASMTPCFLVSTFLLPQETCLNGDHTVGLDSEFVNIGLS